MVKSFLVINLKLYPTVLLTSMRVLKLYSIYTNKYNNIKYNEAYQFVFWSWRS